MNSTKLLQILKTLDPGEWEKLYFFLQSPYFTQEKVSPRLFTLLHPYFADSAAGLPKAETLFQALWPDQPFDRKQLNYALSRLNKLTERFLVFQQLEQQTDRQQLTALEVFSERHLEKHLAATQRSFNERLLPAPDEKDDFYLVRSDYADLLDQHYVRTKARKQDNNIQLATDDLDRFYYFRRLRYACSMLDRQNILEANYRIGLSQAWLDHLEGSTLVEEPMIGLYLTIFRALQEEEQEQHFRELKSRLLQLVGKGLAESLAEPLLFAINYCARKIRAGQEAYVKEAIDLYHRGIDSGLLLQDGQVSPWTYTNLVKLTLRLQQYAEAREFISKYTDLLPESFRENAHNYNYAELLYCTNEKEKAQEYLNRVAFSDLGYYLGARVLLAKIYYETDAEEALLSLLASFTIFLQRNKQISRNLKKTYLNFCQLLSRLLRTEPGKTGKIIDLITHTQPLTDRSWLLALAQEKSRT
ncbi:hypothetical protein QWY85_16155 [Neolewinella lacunae]|uniref:Uncharacterized protein n=1 Tax=Neolewinella lacunae TaxID=1517758 RepID=A0A923TCA7_9BACT|nr:hypothetical protein [Neolewinella lacunae]MBC6993522.1 hypothetical protein [Neolewinella lacunae]MDN3636202.1 hypothetical protein [Neolewinella lacunae]